MILPGTIGQFMASGRRSLLSVADIVASNNGGYPWNPAAGLIYPAVGADTVKSFSYLGKTYVQVEGTRVNLTINSRAQELWTLYKTSVPTTNLPAPDGTLTARRIRENAENDHHLCYEYYASVIGQRYAYSACVKSDTGNRWIRCQNLAGNSWFNPTTGLWGTKLASHNNHFVTPPQNGYYRIGFTYLATGVSEAVSVHPANADGGSGYQGDGISGIQAWNVDAELGAFTTSPIVTAGAPAARYADVLYWPSAGVPAAITDGKWKTNLIMFSSSAETSVGWFFNWSGDIGGSGVNWNAGRINVYSGGLKVSSNALTWSRYDTLTITFDPPSGTIEIVGASVGNGLRTGAAWSWAGKGNLQLGGNAAFYLLSEPEAA